MEQGEGLVYAGVTLFVVGMFLYMAFTPTYISLSMRMSGYETPILTKSDYAYYINLNSFIIPALSTTIVLGLALLLTGMLLYIGRKK